MNWVGCYESMVECTCICCHPDAELKESMVKGLEYDENRKNSWVFVPREPANFGHLVVVSGKHYEDISDKGLMKDTKCLKELLTLINKLATRIKLYLAKNGKRCKKVYVSTLCETKNFHLHFHLIPRFEGEKSGFFFLFDKELEETRWLLKNDTVEGKIHDGYVYIGAANGLLRFHEGLIQSNKWARSNEEREDYIQNTKTEIEEILKKPLTS